MNAEGLSWSYRMTLTPRRWLHWAVGIQAWNDTNFADDEIQYSKSAWRPPAHENAHFLTTSSWTLFFWSSSIQLCDLRYPLQRVSIFAWFAGILEDHNMIPERCSTLGVCRTRLRFEHRSARNAFQQSGIDQWFRSFLPPGSGRYRDERLSSSNKRSGTFVHANPRRSLLEL